VIADVGATHRNRNRDRYRNRTPWDLDTRNWTSRRKRILRSGGCRDIWNRIGPDRSRFRSRRREDPTNRRRLRDTSASPVTGKKMKTILIVLNIALTSAIALAGENANLDTNATAVLTAHGFQYVTLSEIQQKVLDATIDRLALEKQTKAPTRSIDRTVLYLWKTINIAVIQTPRACAEYKGYFWFSRLDTTGPDDQTFRSGIAVRKGTGDIFRWEEPKPQPTAAASPSVGRQEVDGQ
jgi:hypothetical protein